MPVPAATRPAVPRRNSSRVSARSVSSAPIRLLLYGVCLRWHRSSRRPIASRTSSVMRAVQHSGSQFRSAQDDLLTQEDPELDQRNSAPKLARSLPDVTSDGRLLGSLALRRCGAAGGSGTRVTATTIDGAQRPALHG